MEHTSKIYQNQLIGDKWLVSKMLIVSKKYLVSNYYWFFCVFHYYKSFFTCKWGCRTFQTASHIYSIHIWCLNILNSCVWAYGSTFIPLPPQTFPQIWESSLKSYGVWCKCGNDPIETVEPFKLHTTSMSYIHKVFEHHKQLWIGIWQHIHTVTTTDVFPRFGRAGWNHRWCECKCENYPNTLSLRQ